MGDNRLSDWIKESVSSEHEERENQERWYGGCCSGERRPRLFLASITSRVAFYHKQKPFMMVLKLLCLKD